MAAQTLCGTPGVISKKDLKSFLSLEKSPYIYAPFLKQKIKNKKQKKEPLRNPRINFIYSFFIFKINPYICSS
jgi:hypothetical protein